MCYQCNTVSKNPNDIFIHTVNQHEAGGKFSLRQRIFDESIGHYTYRSIHLAIDIIKLNKSLSNLFVSCAYPFNKFAAESNVSVLHKYCR